MKKRTVAPVGKPRPRLVSVRPASPPAPRAVKLRHILVPTDFSPCSARALQYAVSLAKDYGAGITVLHVIEGQAASDEERKKRATALKEFIRQETQGEAVTITTLIKSGGMLREIATLARTEKVDLLVISTHARAGMPDFCLKSAAEEIVRYATCPVLVVRD